jgi:hypothetical protein
MALISTSCTPREQVTLAHSNGRTQIDVVRILSNPKSHQGGRKTFDTSRQMILNGTGGNETPGYMQPQHRDIRFLPQGKKRVDPATCRAAAIKQGSGEAEVPPEKRHIQRRHYETSSIVLTDLPEDNSPPQGKRIVAHPSKEPSKVYAALHSGEEGRRSIKAEIEAQKSEFVVQTSPARRGFDFQPRYERIDNRDVENRLLPGGGRRKERAHYKDRVQTPQEAVTPPWV